MAFNGVEYGNKVKGWKSKLLRRSAVMNRVTEWLTSDVGKKRYEELRELTAGGNPSLGMEPIERCIFENTGERSYRDIQWWIVAGEIYEWNVFVLAKITLAEWSWDAETVEGDLYRQVSSGYGVYLVTRGGQLRAGFDCVAVLAAMTNDMWRRDEHSTPDDVPKASGHFEVVVDASGMCRWSSSDDLVRNVLMPAVQAKTRGTNTVISIGKWKRAKNKKISSTNDTFSLNDVCLLRISDKIRSLPSVPKTPAAGQPKTMPVKIVEIGQHEQGRSQKEEKEDVRVY
jgi:hypothetical protein